MRIVAVVKYLGYVLLFNALFLFISAIISLVLQENSFTPLFYSAIVCSILGFFPQIFIERSDEISFHEGMAISVFGWILTCFAGAVPYFMWGGEFTFANAIFESVSGFTTTGSTILQDVESLTKGMLFWRSSTHFIGGVGIILFVLLIMPDSRGIRASIYRSEVSGLSLMSFKMQAKRIVYTIGIIYISFTVILILLLWVLGMTFFDAVCHSFGTIATGGFSTKNLSIAHYDNVWIEITLTVFMYLSSLHFGMLFLTFSGSKNNIFTTKIIRVYTLFILSGILLIALSLVGESNYSWGEAFRHSSFQVVSLTSTTGYATLDTEAWSLFAKIILIYFSIQCAMAGSTGGGIKFDRIYMFFVSLKYRIKQIQHPQAVYITKISGNVVSKDLELQTMAFIILYILIFFMVALILAAMNIDGTTAFTASITTIGNVGPGFGKISSLSNFSSLPNAAKYLLSVNMLIGRLEILNVITLIVILAKKNR